MDLFHHGKKDDDDHKVVYERMLNVAVPENRENLPIRLEDCLEVYLNTRVDVQRNSEVAKKSSVSEDRPVPQRSQTQPVLSDNTASAISLSTSLSCASSKWHVLRVGLRF